MNTLGGPTCQCCEQRFGPDLAGPSEEEIVAFANKVLSMIEEERTMQGSVTRCKMRVTEVTHTKAADGSTEQERVQLSAVYGTGDTENAKWSKWTPVGKLQH